MKLETAKRLHDALVATEEATRFCSGVTREDFRRNREKQLAVQKSIEIVGEALRQAETTEPDAVKEITDLRKIVDMRNRLVHGYESVDYGVVWDTATKRLPPLQIQLEELLANALPSDYEATE